MTPRHILSKKGNVKEMEIDTRISRKSRSLL